MRTGAEGIVPIFGYCNVRSWRSSIYLLYNNGNSLKIATPKSSVTAKRRV
jgi:hypothetical protein